jgi:titin
VSLSVSGQGATNNQVQGNLFVARLNICAPPIQTCGTGVSVQDATNNVIGGTTPLARNIIFADTFVDDIDILRGSGNLIQGNFIGVDATGALASSSFRGVFVDSRNTTIGGTTPQARNIISGHATDGVIVVGDGRTSTLVQVQGNFIGTDPTGTVGVGNDLGVDVFFAIGTTIGGTGSGTRNIISGNRGNGVVIGSLRLDSPCVSLIGGEDGGTDFTVQGNFIGTDITGNQSLRNGRNGIEVALNAFSHLIKDNRIAFNGRNGVDIPESAVVPGLPGFRIRIADNSIYSNSGLGIDLADDGVTQNDFRDVDSGANLRQNFPLILSSSVPPAPAEGEVSPAARLSVSGTFNSTPNQTFTLQFFFGSGCDASGHQFIGAIPIPLQPTINVTTNNNGDAQFNYTFEFPTGIASGFVNSLATDAAGNTSEASTCLAVANPLRIISACKGEGKQLIVNGSAFVEGAKVFLNGGQEKTLFVSSTQVIAKKAGKRAVTGDTLKVRNPDGTETAVLNYVRSSCSP